MVRSWLATRTCPWAPRWFQQWQRRTRITYLQQTVVPDMLAAQEAGIGAREAWADGTTPAAELLQWIADQIAETERPLATSADQFRLLVAHCRAAEWEAAQETGITLAPERVIATWSGCRSDWWWLGHDAIATAIPEHHDGLYITINALSTVLMAGLAQPSAPASTR